jgi:hypothetical protein
MLEGASAAPKLTKLAVGLKMATPCTGVLPVLRQVLLYRPTVGTLSGIRRDRKAGETRFEGFSSGAAMMTPDATESLARPSN